ncbi:MAG: hypothetical protein ABW189_01515 [Rickettsiales bacterium]
MQAPGVKITGCAAGQDNRLSPCAPHKFDGDALHVFSPSGFIRDRLFASPPERRLWQCGLPDGVRLAVTVFRGEAAGNFAD